MEHNLKKSLFISVGVLVLIALAAFYFFSMKPAALTTTGYKSSASVSASVEVGNDLPFVSNTSLNGGSSIILTPGATTAVVVTGTVSDYNSCQDLTKVNVAVYRNGTTCESVGDANPNNCYFYSDSSPSSDGSCTGPTDLAYAVNHEFSLQYYADGGTWTAEITPIDTYGTGTPDTASVALNELLAIDVSTTLSYGSVSGGSTSTGNHIVTTSNTGNTAIDFTVEGENLVCTGLNALGFIPAENEQYSLSNFSYGFGTALSSTTPAAVDADLATTSGVTISDETFWQVFVPSGVRGTCSGAITFSVTSAI
jgi:hypothetical protein